MAIKHISPPPPPTSTIRGGILAEPATTADTQPVRIGTDGFLYTSIIRSSITVEVKTQDNVTVSGVTVVARENDANGDEIASVQYNGQPVTLDVPRNIHYYIEVVGTLANHFGPNTVSGIASSPSISHIITYQDASNITTYKGVVEAVRLGLNDTLIGKEIADTWTDEDGVVWDDPSIVVHVGNVTDPEGSIHVAAIMQRKYASSKTYVYDAPEQEVPTETTALGDRYYYVKNSSGIWFRSNIGEGDTLPTGYSAITYNDFYDNGNASSDNRKYLFCEAGNGSYPYSAVHQCLNSEADKGFWWSASHIGDSAPSDLNERQGYLKGCSTAMKEYLKPIERKNIHRIPQNGGSSMGYTPYYGKVWLPTVTEMGGKGKIENNQTIFSYWSNIIGTASNSAEAVRKFYTSNNTSVRIALSSLMAGDDTTTLTNYFSQISYISAYGDISNISAGARLAYNVAPCFAIY